MAAFVHKFASSASAVLANTGSESQIMNLTVENATLEANIAALPKIIMEANSRINEIRRELEDLERPLHFALNKEQQRVKRRNDLQIEMSKEQELQNSLVIQKERLESGRQYIAQLQSQDSANRAEFATAACRVLSKLMDEEERYYSVLADRAVAEFFTTSTNGRNIKEAIELIGFAREILRNTEMGTRDNTNLNAIQDIPAAFHHIEIACMIYPPLRSKRLHVTKSSSTGIDGYFNFKSGSLPAVIKHLTEINQFLASELPKVRRQVAVSHTNLLKTSERLKIIRRKLLSYNVTGENVPQFSDTDYDVLFPQDLRRISTVANLSESFASEEDCGRAVGLVYPDLAFSEAVDPIDLPGYDEDGIVAFLAEEANRVL
ncbi:hypothetical protein BDR26DRAFT_588550 [Obelidium mucronatum]|nr:hypothetical protein BDR26DRAFT_588550 [Obelidium mucronatum]